VVPEHLQLEGEATDFIIEEAMRLVKRNVSELGIRHEDTVVVTADGCENLAPKWSGTPEEPAVV
jgi:Xaa-Pro aminopeptidase